MWRLMQWWPRLPFTGRGIVLSGLALYSAGCLAVLAYVKLHSGHDPRVLLEGVRMVFRQLAPLQSLVMIPAMLFARDMPRSQMDERELTQARRAAYATTFVLLIGLVLIAIVALSGPLSANGMGTTPAALVWGVVSLYFLGFLVFAGAQLALARWG